MCYNIRYKLRRRTLWQGAGQQGERHQALEAAAAVAPTPTCSAADGRGRADPCGPACVIRFVVGLCCSPPPSLHPSFSFLAPSKRTFIYDVCEILVFPDPQFHIILSLYYHILAAYVISKGDPPLML